MVLDCEIKELIQHIGHDGSEIIAPHLKPPGCYKGFHDQEIIDVALLRGYSMTLIETLPVQTPDGKFEFELTKWNRFNNNMDRLQH
ncbi:unnamed protein product [marine sediment metagenome]|uniref:Uncharacterized protein n=1 Tax=marine sediment metagenome TaxID=412755 RepID=X1E1H7_9ZZZZ